MLLLAAEGSHCWRFIRKKRKNSAEKIIFKSYLNEVNVGHSGCAELGQAHESFHIVASTWLITE